MSFYCGESTIMSQVSKPSSPGNPVILRIDVDRSLQLNENQRIHWAEHAKRAATLRQLGYMTARTTVPGLRLADNRPWFTTYVIDVAMVPALRTPKKFDPENWYPTVKPLIDGMVDAGLMADDAAGYKQGGLWIRPLDAEVTRKSMHQFIVTVSAYAGC